MQKGVGFSMASPRLIEEHDSVYLSMDRMTISKSKEIEWQSKYAYKRTLYVPPTNKSIKTRRKKNDGKVNLLIK